MYKYLDRWWDSTSEIEPTSTTEDYFKVFYDEYERYVIVEHYDTSHVLQSHDKFFWNNAVLKKIEVYTPNMVLEKYIIYNYKRNGDLTGRDHYSPTGILILTEGEED